MMAEQRPRRAGLVWAVIGGVVVVAGIAAIVVSASLGGGTITPSTRPTIPSASSSAPSPTSDTERYVDAALAERGWVPEPITTDPEVYIRAALAAASTFDTTKSTRDEWLGYLDSWLTPDTRYTSAVDREAQLAAAKLELRQGVVLPEAEWDSLAAERGRVVAASTGDIAYTEVPNDASGDMRIGTSDVTLTSFRSDGAGGETSYEDQVRVSVQVLCGPGSVPTSDSAQRAGDCKVVRWFAGALEP